jgi:hypothetical protein
METQYFYDGGTIIRADTVKFSDLFNLIVYDKGSWVLHMLRKVVGEENFFRILKAYASDSRWIYGTVKTEDFIEICESISGKSLDVFFDQWLHFPYYPQYAYSWDVSRNNASYEIDLTIKQRQKSVVYEMPIDIQFSFSDANDTVFTVLNDKSDQTYKFNLEFYPIQVILDPDNWILKQADEYMDAQFTADVIIENYYPNPFNNEVTIIVRNWFSDKISLDIFDITGRKVRNIKPLNSTNRNTYEFKWDGRKKNNDQVASGVYFIAPSGENASTRFAKKLVKIQ